MRHGRLPHPPRGEDPRDPRHDRQGAARPRQAEPADRQRVARRRDRRGRAGRGDPRGPHRRRRHRRVRHRAHHQLAAVRAAAGGRHPAPRRQHGGGPGQGRRHDRRAGRRWRWPASSCRSPSTSAPAEASSTVRPFLPLAERLGQLYAALAAGVPDVLEVGYEGQLADSDTRILTLSVLKGVFGKVSEEPVSYVNAPRLAEERGIEVRESSSSTSRDYVNLVTIRGGDHAIGGTLVGLRGEARIVMVDDHSVDVPPADHMLVVRNDDVPGMIAAVTGVVGEAGDQHRRHAPRPLGGGPGRPDDPRHRRRRARRRAGRHPRPRPAWSASPRCRARRLSAWRAEPVGLRLGGVRGSSGPGWSARSWPSRAGGRSSRRAWPSPGGWWGRRRRRARPTGSACLPAARRGRRPTVPTPRCRRRASGRRSSARSSARTRLPPRNPSHSPMRTKRRITGRTLSALTRCEARREDAGHDQDLRLRPPPAYVGERPLLGARPDDLLPLAGGFSLSRSLN